MLNKNTNWTSYIIGIFFLAASLGVFLGYQNYRYRANHPFADNYPDNKPTATTPLHIGDKTLAVEVRQTKEERNLGYSGRASITDQQGMVFIFDEPARPLFWMKDMMFPLDVIWIRDGQVIQIHENLPEPTKDNPKVATMIANAEIDMVLEVNAGWVSRMGISVGDKVILE